MSSSTTKKVYLRRFDGEWIAGYANPQTFLRSDGAEILDRAAQVALIPYRSIRAIYFVREFNGLPGAEQRKVFHSRPKQDGLWVRLTFRDGETLEGILPNDLLQMGTHGLTITPPEAGTHAQRVFVPRLALEKLTVLGVIGSPLRRRRPKAAAPSKDQMDLFSKLAGE